MSFRRIVAVLVAVSLAIPSVAAAYPFGGMIGQIIFCYNNAIYAAVGPPRGGPFIWTPSTRTYQFGPPQRVGQWLLGLAAPPYYCLVSVQPIIVWSGILMTMEGSSGGAAPGFPGGFNPTPTPTPPPGPGPSPVPPTPTGIGHMAVSEVYYRADAAHGGLIEHQWVELFNGSSATVDISRWIVRTTSTSQTIPQGTTLAPNAYLVLAGTTSVRTLWTIPTSTRVLVWPSFFPGFVESGDHVYLYNTTGGQLDAMSWGTDRGAFNPSAPTVQLGHSLIRKNLVTDTNTAQDWIDTAGPNPGR